MAFYGADEAETALRSVGELLEAQGEQAAVVIIGGTALNLRGLVARTTTDVDVVALGVPASAPTEIAEAPAQISGALKAAIELVARDLQLPADWMNTGPASQWRQGFPPGMNERIEWRRYSGLHVGLVSRYDLIHFKLHVATDIGGPSHVHFKDLIALAPSPDELDAAAEWVRTQDAGADFAVTLEKVVAYARKKLGYD